MDIDGRLIPHLARLARIDLAAGEEQQLIDRLPKILTYVGQLEKTKTDIAPPPRDVMARLRPDTASQSQTVEAILNQAPDRVERFWRVSSVFT